MYDYVFIHSAICPYLFDLTFELFMLLSLSHSLSLFRVDCHSTSCNTYRLHPHYYHTQSRIDPFPHRTMILLSIVVDHFDLRRDIVYVAINYLDRYCASCHDKNHNHEVDVDVDGVDVSLFQNKNQFQLVAMAALCLALKVYGEIDMDDTKEEEETTTTESWIIETIVQLGRGQFTVEQLKQMELVVLERLQWLLHPPTPQLFVSCYMDELFCPWNNHKDDDDDDNNDDIVTATRTMTTLMLSRGHSNRTNNIEWKELTFFIIELSVHDYYFVMNANQSSVIALAAVLNAAQLLLDASSSGSGSASSVSSSTLMLMRTMTRARPTTTEEKYDDCTVEVADVLSTSSSSLSPLSSTWLMDLHQDLFRNHDTSNTSNDSSADTTTTTCSAGNNGSATACTRTRTRTTTVRMLNAYRERLMKLYTNTDTNIEDFLSNNNNSTSTSNHTNDADDADDDDMIGNNDNDDDGICTTREPSPTTVIT